MFEKVFEVFLLDIAYVVLRKKLEHSFADTLVLKLFLPVIDERLLRYCFCFFIELFYVFYSFEKLFVADFGQLTHFHSKKIKIAYL